MNNNCDHPKLAQLQSRALVIGGAGAVIFLVGGLFFGREKFFQSYLYAFLFWNGLGLGCLSALMLHHMVEGRWGFMIQRILEAGTRMIPVMFVVFLPILFIGSRVLYPWMPGGALADSELIHEKAGYLNTGFFTIRSFVYFGVWIGLTFLLNKFSHTLDKSGDQRLGLRMRWVSGPGLVLYVLTITFASTDWGMSLEPEWFSTIYGPLFIVGQGLACLAFSTIILSKIAQDKPHADVMSTDYFHHLGSLMCGFVVLWSYISFSQFLITWSGNLPEEIPWYLNRMSPSLNVVAVLLIVFHFALPMFILMQRRVKRGATALVVMAVWIFVMRTVDVYWIITPAFHPKQLGLHLMDFAALAGFGGLWIYFFVAQLKKYPLLPLNDQRMEMALAKSGNGHSEAVEHA
ncbi:MAG: hypothetical protein IT365_25540 [Candidatus Hydrogenedentes bacterium]|nr:hypothetical protein [Candidatus Hydrogenedentota bacterium]